MVLSFTPVGGKDNFSSSCSFCRSCAQDRESQGVDHGTGGCKSARRYSRIPKVGMLSLLSNDTPGQREFQSTLAGAKMLCVSDHYA
eukprot:3565146-Rhodomonas_salina.3